MRRLREVIEGGEFAVTVEWNPRRAPMSPPFCPHQALLGIHSINVTVTAVMRMSPRCRLLYEQGTTGLSDHHPRRNRLALRSDLLARTLGIRNVLCLRGADPR
jgi:hypothetical protein